MKKFTIFLIIIGLLFIHFWFNDTLGQYSVCSGHKFTFCSRARHRHNHVIPLIFSVHLLYLLKQFTSGPVTTLNRLNFVKPIIRLYRSVLSSLFNWALRSQKLLSIIVTQMKLRGQKTFNWKVFWSNFNWPLKLLYWHKYLLSWTWSDPCYCVIHLKELHYGIFKAVPGCFYEPKFRSCNCYTGRMNFNSRVCQPHAENNRFMCKSWSLVWADICGGVTYDISSSGD